MEQEQMHIEPERKEKDRILPVSILVAALMIAGALVFATLYKGGSPAGSGNAGNNNGGTAAAGPSASQVSALLALGPRDAVLGNGNAPVTIVEYGDYQCPFCAEYYSTTQRLIIQNYVTSGKAKMVFRNFPFLGPESVAAAQAAECAEDQNQLWAYHDALYAAKIADDNKNGSENDGTLNRKLFLALAGQLHMNTSTFASCIDTGKYAALVTQEASDANSAGVHETPSTFVNGVMVVGADGKSVGADTNSIVRVIEAALK